MTKVAMETDHLLNRRESGIWVFGDPVLDYLVKDLQTTQIGATINSKEGIEFSSDSAGIRIMGGDKEVLVVNFPLMPDGSGVKPTLELYAGGKYTTAKNPTVQGYIDIPLEQVSVIVGGGEPNFAIPITQHSPEIKVAVTGLRPEKNSGALFGNVQTLDMLVQGADKEAGNLAIVGIDGKSIDKIIARGPNLYNQSIVPFDQTPDFNVGTFVLNSSNSSDIVDEFLKQYESAYQNAVQSASTAPLEVICLTSKMAKSYAILSERAVKRGALTIYNPTEVVKYGLRDKSGDKAHGKKEQDLTYYDVLKAMKSIRREQGSNPQRIYVTLGKYGCLAMDEYGEVYRTNIFDVDEGDTNGAGDRAASMIAKMEHERVNCGANYPILEVMATASATAASFIKNKDVSKQAIQDVMHSQDLEWEYLRNINQMQVGDSMYMKTLGSNPITGNCKLMEFK